MIISSYLLGNNDIASPTSPTCFQDQIDYYMLKLEWYLIIPFSSRASEQIQKTDLRVEH